MRYSMLALVFGCGIALLLARGGEAVEGDSLLVRVEARYSAPDIQTRIESFIYKDGAVVRRSRSASHGASPTVSVQRLHATASQVAALNTSLRANRVGSQTGQCSVGNDNPLLGYVQVQLDWFGRAGRQNSFLAESRFQDECGQEVRDILITIEGLVGAAQELDSATAADLIEEINP